MKIKYDPLLNRFDMFEGISISLGSDAPQSADNIIFNGPPGSVVFVGTTAYISLGSSGTSSTVKAVERFVLTSDNITTDGFITLSKYPHPTEHEFVILNGIVLDNDTDGDYIILNNQIIFTASLISLLTPGDKMIVKYRY